MGRTLVRGVHELAVQRVRDHLGLAARKLLIDVHRIGEADACLGSPARAPGEDHGERGREHREQDSPTNVHLRLLGLQKGRLSGARLKRGKTSFQDRVAWRRRYVRVFVRLPHSCIEHQLAERFRE